MKPRSHKRTREPTLSVRALRTRQGRSDVYSFFVPGGEIGRIADITRVERDENDVLRGFQRKEIREHVRAIVQYLDHGNVLFPNAITLAMSPEVRFIKSRGPRPDGLISVAEPGTLTFPVRDEGERVGWIVDGQQRSLALAQTKNTKLPVPVVAFVSDDLEVQREQFILMNKARPLPTRLINELLPETDSVLLPKDLAARRIPSGLCSLLNRDARSPFHGLIKRASDSGKTSAVVIDTALIKMIRSSINSPLGALSPYKSVGDDSPADIESMYRTLSTFWTSVRDVFPEAWGLPPTKSRLMHSAGIESMGILMDKIYARHAGKPDEAHAIKSDLERMAEYCCWTEGAWEGLGLEWNEIQNTPKHIRALSDTLVRLYAAKVPR